MFTRSRKPIALLFRRNLHFSLRLTAREMIDPLEHATGLEKRERCLRRDGNTDPWHNCPIRRGPGTKENPTKIPSAFEGRIVGCICNPDQRFVNFMWLWKGEPKRCECGYWFELKHVDPV